MNIDKILKENKGTIVDVRTPDEFRGGHVAGAINIPLQELDMRMTEIKSLTAPLVLCCASGNRSGMATRLLSQLGINCINGGSWMDVNFLQAQTA